VTNDFQSTVEFPKGLHRGVGGGGRRRRLRLRRAGDNFKRIAHTHTRAHTHTYPI